MKASDILLTIVLTAEALLQAVTSFSPLSEHAKRVSFYSGTTSLFSQNSPNDDLELERSAQSRRDLLINTVAGGLLVASGVATWQFYQATLYSPPGFRRVPTQFIAALGDPSAKQGTVALEWGLWKVDPGPRGVWLRDYETTLQNGATAPAGWKFDPNDWWVEEHGLIMEAPSFPMPSGRYLVTGGRAVTTVLTVQPNGHWSLEDGTLQDVTHLPCRSARYKPMEETASPANARANDFPVKPGAVMPSIPGTSKQDYAVLFLVGKASSA